MTVVVDDHAVVDPVDGPAPARRGAWPRGRLVVWGGIAILALWTVVVAVLGLRGADAARVGADRVRAIETGVSLDVLVDGDVLAQVREAQGSFADADRLLGNPLLAPVRFFPIAGRQLRSASSLAAAGDQVLTATASALEVLEDELADGVPSGPDRVRVLGRMADELERLRDVIDGLDLGPSHALIGPLHRARLEVFDKVEEASTQIGDVLTISRAVEGLLDGPSTYLVVAANNAEMRVGSGMFLSVGTIDIADGAIESDTFRPAADLVLADGGVAVPDEIDALWGWAHPGADLRNLGLSARFPENAEIAARFWEAQGNDPVDGVLLVDVVALRELLAATGPVVVDDLEVSADNVESLLLVDQYAGLPPEVDADNWRDFVATNDARRERLSSIAGEVLHRLGSTDLDLGGLLENLRSARDGRHLMAWSADPEQQAAWDLVGVDGELSPWSLLVGYANVDGGKLDPFVHLDVELTSAPAAGGTRSLTLDITIVNEAAGELSGYVLGTDGDPTHRGIVVVHLPGDAEAIEIAADGGFREQGPDGPTTVVAVGADVAPGARHRVTVTFRVPARSVLTVEPGARVPATTWHIADRSTTDRHGMTFEVDGT